MSYIATDEDLPDFFRDGTLPAPAKIDAQKHAQAAVQLHYPAIIVKQKRREARAVAREHRELARGDKKQYVKVAKKLQMFDWLCGLEQAFPIMRSAERGFCEQLLVKFRKYTPYAVKWVTRKQYNWLLYISSQYLRLPK